MIDKLMRYALGRRLACRLADMGIARDRLEEALFAEFEAACSRSSR